MGRTSYDPQRAQAVKKRTQFSAVLVFLLLPLLMILGTFLAGGEHYMLLSLLVVVCTMMPFFMVFERRKPKAREIVLVAMMTAITVAAHMALHVTVPLQIGTAMVVIAGISMGPEAGFLVGALSRFVCNFYMGQGPWTPWQMFCWGLLGFLAGLTFNKVDIYEETEGLKSRNFRVVLGPVLCIVFAEVIAYVSFLLAPGSDSGMGLGGWRVYAFGAVGLLAGVLLQRKRMPVDTITITVFTFFTTVILYGGIMNLSALFTMPGYSGQEISWATLRALFISGLPYDLAHGGAAALCIFVMGNPMIRKIERIKIKYGIYK